MVAAKRTVFPGAEWAVERPEEHGLSAEALARATEGVRAVEERYGFLVVKDGVIVHESYFTGDKDSKYRTFSVTKGIVTSLSAAFGSRAKRARTWM